MDSKSVVTVSRKWHEPQIRVWVSQEEIGMSMWLDDYLKALAKEVGNPATLLTNAQLLRVLQKAAINVETEMKLASKAVIK
jgi:hypothetical protein